MTDLHIEENVALTHNNTFGIAAYARRLWRITHDAQLAALAKLPPEQAQALLAQGFVVLGGGSNIVLTGDVQPLVLKMETRGMALVDENSTHWIVQAAAGETWHDLVTWTLQQGYPGLENLALIPGSVGAAPVQNIGAYGLNCKIASTVWTRWKSPPAAASRWMPHNATLATANPSSSTCQSSPQPATVGQAAP